MGKKYRIQHSVRLRSWTPARAAGAAQRRIDKIEDLLIQIGGLYGDVDQMIVDQCDELVHQLRGEGGLAELIEDARAAGRQV